MDFLQNDQKRTIVFMVVFYTVNTAVHFPFLTEAATPAGIAVIHSAFNISVTKNAASVGKRHSPLSAKPLSARSETHGM